MDTRGRRKRGEKCRAGGGGGKDAKKREIGRMGGGGEEKEGNTWPHPDFMHATTRAEEETERVEFAALPDHART